MRDDTTTQVLAKHAAVLKIFRMHPGMRGDKEDALVRGQQDLQLSACFAAWSENSRSKGCMHCGNAWPLLGRSQYTISFFCNTKVLAKRVL